MRHFPLFSVVVLCGALSAGCASTPASDNESTPTGFLSDYSKLEPDTEDPGARIYLKADVDWKKYDKIMLDRIQIWLKDDADYKGIDPTQLKALTDYFQQAIVKALEPTYPVVTQPGPDVLRVRIAITDLIPTKPEMSVVALVVPYATVADLASGGGTGSTPYLGQTAIEAEFLDSRSNQALAAYVDREIGKKYDVDLSQGVGSAVEKGVSSYTKAYSTWAYAEAAFDAWAGRLRQRLDQAHGRTAPAH
ncbi:MAG: DUF3313 domain-containing protein [Candidatus Competibacteraceae bacterium]|nr:MAG: DUF3313 domain-containing protein [Candidatus Competibacteraceae bacterium]